MTTIAGLNVKGKVAVIFSGSPADMPSALASHYQSSTERAKELREAGAIGYIIIPNPAAMDIPWSRMTLARKRPSMSLADPMFNDWKGIGLAGVCNPEFAEEALSRAQAIPSPKSLPWRRTASHYRTFL